MRRYSLPTMGDMARPLRIEFNGALYHVTSRGDRREPIYEDDEDRVEFLSLLGVVCKRFNWLCHSYCLMTNHYHILIETPDANLSKGMRYLNGVYSQRYNNRHQLVGHLFQGRYKAIIVDTDSYLLELSRYVVLNPVRAGMVESASEWPWSSYLLMVGSVVPPEWLAVDGMLAMFGTTRIKAIRSFKEFVEKGIDAGSPWDKLKQQIYLGDDCFVERMQALIKDLPPDINIPNIQTRSPVKSLEEYEKMSDSRNAAIVKAYKSGGYSYQEIAEYFNIHFTTVGKIVRKALSKSQG